MWKNMVDADRPQMTIRCMHITCWMPTATNTHSGYVTRTAFHCNNGYTNAPQCYVIRTVPVLLISLPDGGKVRKIGVDISCLSIRRLPDFYETRTFTTLFRKSPENFFSS